MHLRVQIQLGWHRPHTAVTYNTLRDINTNTGLIVALEILDIRNNEIRITLIKKKGNYNSIIRFLIIKQSTIIYCLLYGNINIDYLACWTATNR